MSNLEQFPEDDHSIPVLDQKRDKTLLNIHDEAFLRK